MKIQEHLKIGDLVKLKSNGSVGYAIWPSDPPPKFGEEVPIYCCIKWIDGDLKNSGWISIDSKIKNGENDMLRLITNDLMNNFYRERYPFSNCMYNSISYK